MKSWKGIAFAGGDLWEPGLKLPKAGITSFESCMDHCLRIPQCNAVSYDDTVAGQNCFLKSNPPASGVTILPDKDRKFQSAIRCDDSFMKEFEDAFPRDPDEYYPTEGGGFTCTCNTGFSGDGVSCLDIDECLSTPCDLASSTCSNNIGGYNCICKPGYEDKDEVCVEIDECATGSHYCSPDATCVNTDGSFECICNAGFDGDGKGCSDINECDTNNGGCNMLATCSNTVGGNVCFCDEARLTWNEAAACPNSCPSWSRPTSGG